MAEKIPTLADVQFIYGRGDADRTEAFNEWLRLHDAHLVRMLQASATQANIRYAEPQLLLNPDESADEVLRRLRQVQSGLPMPWVRWYVSGVTALVVTVIGVALIKGMS